MSSNHLILPEDLEDREFGDWYEDIIPTNGEERIAAVRKIVTDKQFAKIEGAIVDMFSATYIVSVYDRLNEANQKKYREMNVVKMAKLAFSVATQEKP